MNELELNVSQLKCLASPACSTVVQALMALHQASATDIARAISRSPATVHYHLNSLLDCSLIREAFRRSTARRPEAVYEFVAGDLKLPAAEPHSVEGALTRRAVIAGLRQVMRGYESAAKAPRTEDAITHVLRAQIRLSAEDAQRFIGMLEAASKFAADNRLDEGALLHWCSILYP